MKKCPSCHFKNPLDAPKCLNCGRDLPMPGDQEALKKLLKGDIGGAMKSRLEKLPEEMLKEQKYKLHPGWWIKKKLFRLKLGCLTWLIIFIIIGILILIGFVVEHFK